MSLSLLSFLVALIVITILLTIMLKQKARPARKGYAGVSGQPDAPSEFSVELVQSKWAEISAMQNSGPLGLKSALIEADKLLDYCMIGKGFAGDTMGERLKTGGHKFGNINAIWAAHKLRNQLAHEVKHDLVASQVKQAITSLGNAIRELGVTI